MSQEGPNKKVQLYQGQTPSNTLEQREPGSTQYSHENVFKQEDPSQPSRYLTLEAQGQTVTQRPDSGGGPEGSMASERREVGSQEHSVGEQSAAWWNEPRNRRNEKK